MEKYKKMEIQNLVEVNKILQRLEKDKNQCKLLLGLENIEFFLLEVFKMYIKIREKEILNVLLDKSLISFHFSIKFSWIMDSWLKENPEDKELLEFRNKFEDILFEPQKQKELFEKINEKQIRSNLFNEQIIFFYNLTDLSFRLKDYPQNIRNSRLKIELESIKIPINAYIPFLSEKQTMLKILKIRSEYSRCFSTKERVPYLIVLEVQDTGKRIDKLFHSSEIELKKDEISETESNEKDEKKFDEIFGSSWKKKREIIFKKSIYSSLSNWDIYSFIVKARDDLRNESFVLKMMKVFKDIFVAGNLPIFIKPYSIIVITNDSGLIETLNDSVSIDSLKKSTGKSLEDFYKENFKNLKQAQMNFASSMAGYAIFTYLLQIKDRHNGNIMIDREGHIIHIDFGFFLNLSSPGGVNFEKAPFKFTNDDLALMGGKDSEIFKWFKMLFHVGFLEVRKYKKEILNLAQLNVENQEKLKEFDERFYSSLSEDEFAKKVNSLIEESIDNFYTKQYDNFQNFSNGIL